MVSDSSRITTEVAEQLKVDNDVPWLHNIHDDKVHAFPYLAVILKLNDRINELELRVRELGLSDG